MSTPRKHHYLPQFYLEGFKIEPRAGKNPHIWQIEKGGEQIHYSPAIQDTGCIRDYHSMDFEDQEPDHKTIEALLSNVEAEHATVVQHLKTTKRLETPQIALLSAFISLMRYRVPTFADHIETSLRSVVLDAFKIMYQAGSFPAPPQESLNMFESKGIDDSLQIRISNWKVLSHMFAVGLGPESISLLTQFNYHIYSAEGSDFFVSSDNPVALFHPN